MTLTKAKHDKFIDKVMDMALRGLARDAAHQTVAAFFDWCGGSGLATVSATIYGHLQTLADIRDLMDECGLTKQDVYDLLHECTEKILAKGEARANKAVDKAFLKSCVHHCSKCGQVGHNKRTCGR